MSKSLEDWVKAFELLYLGLGLLSMGAMFLSNISTVHAFRLQMLYFVILCFSNSALLHGLKQKKINCGILWLVFGLMETIMILIYSTSHIYASMAIHDINSFAIPLIFLLTAVINISCWIIVYRYLRNLSKKGPQNTLSNQERRHNQVQIRYNSNGQIDILQDTRGLSPGIYAIAPVHNKDRYPSGIVRHDGAPTDMMVYPNPESGNNIGKHYLRIIYRYFYVPSVICLQP